MAGFCVLVSLMVMVSAFPNKVATGHLRRRNCNKKGDVLLTCPDKLIQIQTALYEKPGKNGCTDPSAKTTVAAECNGKESCSFKVKELFASSTCTSAQAKLKLHYKCVTKCSDNHCGHGGTCTLNEATGSAQCCCTPGYAGPTCSKREPNCQCNVGYTGAACDSEECSDDHCGNQGTCTLNAATGLAQCCCTPGYTGSTCSERVPFNPCDNKGTYEGSKCICSPDFGGDLCTIPCNPLANCPSGFEDIGVNGSCYFFPNSTAKGVNWHKAKTLCEEKGANLWEPDDDLETTTITDKLGMPSDDNLKRYYTAANDINDEDTYIMVKSGKPFTGTIPGNNQDTRDCIQLRFDGTWIYQHKDCDVDQLYICEIKLDPCLN